MPIRCRIQGPTNEGDMIVAAELDGREVGSLKLKLVPFVHDMRVDQSALSRKVADALLNYAQGYVRASGPIEAFFVVDPANDVMHRWLQDHGAILEDPSNLYMMDVK